MTKFGKGTTELGVEEEFIILEKISFYRNNASFVTHKIFSAKNRFEKQVLSSATGVLKLSETRPT